MMYEARGAWNVREKQVDFLSFHTFITLKSSVSLCHYYKIKISITMNIIIN